MIAPPLVLPPSGDGLADLFVGAPRFAGWCGRVYGFRGVDLARGGDLEPDDACPPLRHPLFGSPAPRPSLQPAPWGADEGEDPGAAVRLTVLPLVLLLAACDPPTRFPDPPDTPEAPADPEGTRSPRSGPRFAEDLAVADVLLMQGSSLALSPAGPAPLGEVDVPVVAGRDALLRVMLQPGPRWAPRPIRVEVAVETDLGERLLDRTVTPEGPSAEEDLASSVNIDLPAALVRPESTVRVSLLEADPSRPGAREPGAAVFPSSGGAPLLATPGGVVEVWFVPLLYHPDGSDRAPDTSPEQLERLRSTVERQYPVTDVLFEVLAPVALERPILSDGGGWSEGLYQVSGLRRALAVPDDVYLYGLVAPANDARGYCPRGCVTGLSWVGVNPASAWTRASLGLGFSGARAADTFAHELGHAHGRLHAPCGGPADPDPAYPNGGGRLGTWGWDREDAALIDPAAHGDLMGYCRPRWVSDYTFAALQRRVLQVESPAFVGALPGWPRTFAVLDLPKEGEPAVKARLSLDRPPVGAPEEVELLDADGGVTARVEGTIVRFEDTGSAALLFPPGDAVALRFRGSVAPI